MSEEDKEVVPAEEGQAEGEEGKKKKRKKKPKKEPKPPSPITFLVKETVMFVVFVIVALIAVVVYTNNKEFILGQKEITVESRWTDGASFSVTDTNGVEHFVDRDSYEIAYPGEVYRVEKRQYTEHLIRGGFKK